jgi:predicted dehydrogenase
MIKWGIIGGGRIAHRFMKSLAYSDCGVLYAIASHTLSKQEQLKKAYPQVHIYASYDELLNDSQVDVVYIAIRHGDHYQWAKQALLHQIAVLCEKPATLSYQQTQELCDLARENQVFFMEGLKTRFIPLIPQIKKVLNQNMIGTVYEIYTSFCNDVPFQEQSYLFDAQQGGALYDVGIYNIASILDYIHSPVENIKSHVEWKYGVDSADYIELTFKNGVKAIIEISICYKKENEMIIRGEKGNLYAMPFYRPEEFIVDNDEGHHVYCQKYIYDDFYTEIMEVHHCLKKHMIESPRMTHQNSLDCMKLLERIKESFYE